LLKLRDLINIQNGLCNPEVTNNVTSCDDQSVISDSFLAETTKGHD